MRSLHAIHDGAHRVHPFTAALLAVPLYFFMAPSLQLFSEYFDVIRSGVMVDRSVCGYVEKGAGWNTIETAHFTIYVESGIDLGAVKRRLRNDFSFFSRKAGRGTTEENIASRLDSIFTQARDMLDMYPAMPKIRLKIFKSGESLDREYRAMTGNNHRMKAFYVHDCDMIYTCEEELSDSVIVHETAHAIVDHYYKGIPPPRISEALASYVDMQLSD